jgi:beta-1,2-mannobiose phosphorylase / 1,2-beta-oligomannan phosphorylase
MINPEKNSFNTVQIFCKLLAIDFFIIATACTSSRNSENGNNDDKNLFPEEIVRFSPFRGNPVFKGTGTQTWDKNIRERGYIIKEDDGYHLWYTGYQENTDVDSMSLGYATSPDGLVWTRYPHNPIFSQRWTEDMMVIKSGDIYYMFAEGRNDVAHMLTSTDKIHWTDQGSLQIVYTNGQPLSPGPYGTPTVIREDSVWYLFYERNDEGIWLATSADLKQWKNIQDEPVLKMGPEEYDHFGLAVNQIINYKGKYYAYYHGTAFKDWHEWSTNVAVSEDLLHWKKYDNNPIMKENKSSGILVHDGSQYRLYTMHPEVCVHFADKEGQ